MPIEMHGSTSGEPDDNGYVRGAIDPNSSRGVLNTLARRSLVDPNIPEELRGNPIAMLRHMAYTNDILMRSLAPLPPEAGEVMDSVVTEVIGKTNGLVPLLINRVERSLPNWWSITSVQHLKISKQGRAHITMTPGNRTELSMRDRTPVSTAIPAIEEPFEYHDRFLAVAQGAGVDIETESLEAGVENVMDTAENWAFNGPKGVNFGGITMYGLDTAPNANTFNFVDNEAWDAAGHSGQDIFDDCQTGVKAAINDGHRGPFAVVHDSDYSFPLNKMFTDGTTTQTTSTRNVILDGIPEIEAFVMSERCPADTVYFVELKTSSCGIFVGQDPTWIPLPAERFVNPFLILGCLVPYFRDSYDSSSGIVKGTPS